MPSIGSSPGVGSGVQVDVSKVRAQTTSDSLTVSTQDTSVAGSAAASVQASVQDSAQGTAVTTTATSAGQQAPVDLDRVSTIRKAIQSGNYPVVPTKIGDAMIAAGLLLRGAQ